MDWETAVIVLFSVFFGSISTYLINHSLQNQRFIQEKEMKDKDLTHQDRVRLREKKEECIKDLIIWLGKILRRIDHIKPFFILENKEIYNSMKTKYFNDLGSANRSLGDMTKSEDHVKSHILILYDDVSFDTTYDRKLGELNTLIFNVMKNKRFFNDRDIKDFNDVVKEINDARIDLIKETRKFLDVEPKK